MHRSNGTANTKATKFFRNETKVSLVFPFYNLRNMKPLLRSHHLRPPSPPISRYMYPSQLARVRCEHRSVLNHLPSTVLVNASLSAKLQSPGEREDLEDRRMARGASVSRPNPAPSLAPTENLDMIVEHTLKKLGTHTLRVRTVGFTRGNKVLRRARNAEMRGYRGPLERGIFCFSLDCTLASELDAPATYLLLYLIHSQETCVLRLSRVVPSKSRCWGSLQLPRNTTHRHERTLQGLVLEIMAEYPLSPLVRHDHVTEVFVAKNHEELGLHVSEPSNFRRSPAC